MEDNKFYGNYASNAIFRNQPNYKYFNDAVHNASNPLFRNLNEIDEHFMYPKNINMNDYDNLVVIDPRTNEVIDQRYINVNLSPITNCFHINVGSTLTHLEHKRGVDYIFNKQRNGELLETDNIFWEGIQKKLREENSKFAEIFRYYCLNNKEVIYESSKKFVKLYQIWYKMRVEFFKQKYLNDTYNTYMGLLHVRNFDTLNDISMQISNVKILEKTGEQIELTENTIDCHKQFNVNLGFRNIDIFAHIYAEDQMNNIDLTEKLQIEKYIIQSFENYEENGIFSVPFAIAIPMTSLLFLLTSGDYDDLPTEMIFSVKQLNCAEEEFSNNQKYIIMDEPFPAQDCGWHTNNLVLEQIVVARLSTLNQYDDSNSQLGESINDDKVDSIDNESNNKSDHKYTLIECDEYMKKTKQKQSRRCKFQQYLSKWTLDSKRKAKIDQENIYDAKINSNSNNNKENIDDIIEVYTIIDASMSYTTNCKNASSTSNDSCNKQFYTYSTKLEYNVEYGCEVMTKYELIREWFYLKLLKNCGRRICYRIDVDSCDIFCEEEMILERIESSLKSLYNIDMNLMLIKLKNFLKMLKNLPNDQYLMRYNLRFKEKILICKRSKEVSANILNLHSLLEKEPNNLLFLSKDNFLEISPEICSRMHLDHTIMPCCFKAEILKTLVQHGRQKLPKAPVVQFNDRVQILKRIADKKTNAKKRKYVKRKKVNRK